MKAILRWGLCLVGLVLVSTTAHGYYWVTPVTRCPYPQAPSLWNSGYYLMDSQGRWTGPHYYLVPPTGPFNGFLPGPVGAAIMSGNLPHKLLMSPQAQQMGQVPMLPSGHRLFNSGMNAGTGAPPMDNPGMPPMPYMAQVPYGSAPMQNAGVPAYAPMPYAQPYPTQQMASPYPQQTNVWPAHNTHPAPFAPIPSFAPPGYGPAMPPYPQFSPMQPPMPPMPPTAPMPNMTPMELPHMAMPKAPNGYPTHPFTRSPRDFFMWSENMEDEARMRNRPFPVPR